MSGGERKRWTRSPLASSAAPPSPALRQYTPEELKEAVLAKLTYAVGKDPVAASSRDWFLATALRVARLASSTAGSPRPRATYADDRKRVYYLSLEFLIGRLLLDALNNLGLIEPMRAALAQLGVDLDAAARIEPDAALGNGGLGRLAACFMESMATLAIAAYGYGIRYDHGLFRQIINDGWQHEMPENWLAARQPLGVRAARGAVYAHRLRRHGRGGRRTATATVRHVWHPAETVEAIAYDTPVVGWRGRHVNTLRLWSARARRSAAARRVQRAATMSARSPTAVARRGHLPGALSQRRHARPARSCGCGRSISSPRASLQDLVRRHITAARRHPHACAEQVAIQLNDTHPAIAVAELMRLLVDVHRLRWEEAWEITQATFSYTNHTLLPEALESWPVPLMERLLPRHMQIIYLINALHLDGAAQARARAIRATARVGLADRRARRPPRAHGLRSPSSARTRSTASRRCTPT